ncbi:MAG: hypothetical protein JXM73_10535 [Anaerolineae bacterium]|nr:hypothetical protein [Anaerolineae bacterium]
MRDQLVASFLIETLPFFQSGGVFSQVKDPLANGDTLTWRGVAGLAGGDERFGFGAAEATSTRFCQVNGQLIDTGGDKVFGEDILVQ